MAETGGEKTGLIILFAIIAFVIIAIFAYFLLFGFGFSNSTTCFGSSEISNFYYNDLCLRPFCASDTLSALNIYPPLLGCSPTSQSFSSSTQSGSVFNQIANDLSSCWYQYGGQQSLTVLRGKYQNPALCSVVNLDMNQNFTFGNLTAYLKSDVYTTKLSCLNHTAAQSCPNYQEGYTCDTQDPTTCQVNTNSYFQCQDQQGYTGTYQNFVLAKIPLNGSKYATTAVKNMSSYLCDFTQAGCVFNTATASCVNSSDHYNQDSCTQLFTNFCTDGGIPPTVQQIANYGGYNCTVDLDPTTDTFSPPPSCSLSEPVNPNSFVNVTYYDYFSPGLNLFYSYKNKSVSSPVSIPLPSNWLTGAIWSFIRPDNLNRSINHASLYIYYLNSFANSPSGPTRFTPQKVTLPQECYPETFYDNYPSNCYSYCEAAAISAGSIFVGSQVSPGMVIGGTALASGFAVGGFTSICGKIQSCNQYVLPGAYSGALKLTETAFLVTTGLQGCFQCLTAQANSLSGISVAGRSLLFICAQTS